MSCHGSHLGLSESEKDKLFAELYEAAYRYFPKETAKAESWLQEQLVRYGIHKTRTTTQAIFQSPWTWGAIGAILALMMKR